MHRDHPLAAQGTLYARLANADEQSELAAALFATGESFGFRSASYILMPARTQTTLSNNVVESNLPSAFFEEHDRLADISHCPDFKQCRTSILPVVWRLHTARVQASFVADKPIPLLEFYASQGIKNSLLVPLRSLDGRQYLVRFDGDRQEPVQSEINELTMLASIFFQKYDRLRYPMPQNPAGLTDREIEIIEWTASGKTSTEIAGILSLSDHTVNAHILHACKKLDCVARAQLVAKAIRMRIIN